MLPPRAGCLHECSWRTFRSTFLACKGLCAQKLAAAVLFVQELFPIIIGALFRSSQQHWSATVHTLTYNVSKLLAQADTVLFDECSSRFMAEEKR